MADFAEINAVLGRFTSNVNTELDHIMSDVADEAVAMLKAEAPVHTGAYKKGFRKDHDKGRYIVKNNEYRLTHLLEKGHDIVVNGINYGRYKGQPHWQQAEKMVQEQMMKRIEEIFK